MGNDRRQDRIELAVNKTVSRGTYAREAHHAADTMTEFINSILAGEVPLVLVQDLFDSGIKPGPELVDLIEAWRHTNLEAIALTIENIEILHCHEQEMDLDAFWQFCGVCNQLEDSLRSRLISPGA